MTTQVDKAENQALKKPSAIMPDLESVPEYLRKFPHWILWRYDLVEGKYRKVPYCPYSQFKAKTNNKNSWSAFSYARNAYESNRTKYDGVAIVASSDDDLVLIDLDHHLEHNEETGEFILTTFAAEIIESFDSYTEISPSQTGIHIIIRGKLPENIRHKVAELGLEVYDTGRSLAITGRIWDKVSDVMERQDALDRLIEKHLKKEIIEKKYPVERLEKLSGTPDEVLKKAFASNNGGSIERLYHGDTSDYGGDDSNADMAFCGKMAFWVGGDAVMLDRIFRSSRLMRDKWDKVHYADGRTYGEVTIARAISSCRQFYQWSKPARDLVRPAGVAKSRPVEPPAPADELPPEPDWFASNFIAGDEPVAEGGYVSKWAEPIPLDEKPLPQFPVHLLPEYMRQYVSELSNTTQTPVDLAASLVLGAIAGAAHGKVIINVKPGWWEHFTLYTLAVMVSGSRKTAVFRSIMRPFVQREMYLAETEKPIVDRNAKRKKVLEGQYAKIVEKLQNPKDDKERQELERQLGNVEKEMAGITKLHISRLLAENITTERLMSVLARHDERLTISAPEGGVFKLIAGLYSGNKSSDIDIWLKAYDAEWMRLDRQDQERTVALHRPSLAMILSVQPQVIEDLAKEPQFLGRGLVQRFLFSFPPDNLGYREVENIPDINPATYEKYRVSMRKLLEMEMGRDGRNHAEPTKVSFSPNAQKKITEYQKANEMLLRDKNVPPALREWRSKQPGKVARIAVALHLAEHVDASQYGLGFAVSEETVNAAIEMGRYFEEQVEAAFRIMAADEDRVGAKVILDWIRREERRSFTQRELLRGCGRSFKKVADMTGPLTFLGHYGYVVEVGSGGSDRMVKRSTTKAWEVNPLWLEKIVNSVKEGEDR